MTRKCVICKETNYKNTYSFFSAPKDPETRKKWQNVISIENYAVTDDTYVCSKHFNEDDIITHWVSGVPPHVITIKYKKCRLRPGAVPSNYHVEGTVQTIKQEPYDPDINIKYYSPCKIRKISSLDEKKRDHLKSKTEKSQINCDENRKTTPRRELFHKLDDYEYNSNRISFIKLEMPENDSNASKTHEESRVQECLEKNLKQTKQNKQVYEIEETILPHQVSTEDANFEIKKEVQAQTCKDHNYLSVSKKVLESASKVFDVSEEDRDQRPAREDSNSKEKAVFNSFLEIEHLYAKRQIVKDVSYDQLNKCYSMYKDIEDIEILFEDLLEVCTELLLPPGWSCLVTSKGDVTTIVYLFMAMTKNGMPFTEKQVFIKSDMVLHCVAVNREINPLIHNLIREGKHLKVQNLLDVEELIDEFDQRTICQGIRNTRVFRKVSNIKVAYKDGIKWRHISCPLIVNNDSLRCTRCITLAHKLQHRSKSSNSFSCNLPTFTKKKQKIHSRRQKSKCTRKHDRRYEFIKLNKE
ncbi:uncharacterized protein LOC128892637 [Hylaeus anthracinus]|uniref:uncharacterized protein LOC128892637 n=1 Tax=Hylaeus anthracinus TaxID=313031 RepID=UPI0023B93CC8|nr:uncharacterized protein LOC128892637 [Hylaeus anthracinus]